MDNQSLYVLSILFQFQPLYSQAFQVKSIWNVEPCFLSLYTSAPAYIAEGTRFDISKYNQYLESWRIHPKYGDKIKTKKGGIIKKKKKKWLKYLLKNQMKEETNLKLSKCKTYNTDTCSLINGINLFGAESKWRSDITLVHII